MRNLEIVDIQYYDTIVGQINSVRLNILLLNLLAMSILIAIAVVILRSIHLDLLKRNLQNEKEKRDVELKALQAQVTPHFMFNTLNSIRWAAINNNPTKAADMTLALSSLLRMTISNEDKFITIDAELENLKNYVAIFQMRQAVDYILEIDIPEELKSYLIPKLLFQPIVENSLIHGFDGKVKDCIIRITGNISSGSVYITISDNGVGMNVDEKNIKPAEPKLSAIGIDNVDQRIKLNYGEEYGLVINSVIGEGTSVQLHLPQIENNNYV